MRRYRRSARAATIMVLLVLGPPCRAVPEAPRPRVLWMNWDGAARDLIHPMLEDGRLPHLSELANAGVRADFARSVFPSRTAPGFAALWTGAPPSVNGITGNTVPVPGEPLTAGVTGYSAQLLVAEPIWTAAARQGLTAVGLEPTQAWPPELFGLTGRFGGEFSPRQKLVTGYGGPLYGEGTLPGDGAPVSIDDLTEVPASVARSPSPPRLWRWPLAPEAEPRSELPTHLLAWVYDDPERPTSGYDSVLVTAPGSDALVEVPVSAAAPEHLSPETESIPAGFVRLGLGTDPVTFYLRCWNVTEGVPTCYRSEAGFNLGTDPELAELLEDAAAGFVGNGGSRPYEDGAFGPPVWEGGDGTAERRYLETVALTIGHLGARHRAAAGGDDWDLLIAYLPYPDEAMHAWWGFVGGAPAHDPRIDAVLNAALRRLMGWLDAALAALRESAGPNVVTLLTSDHGYVAVDRVFRPNVVLRSAGLLAVDAAAATPELDLSATRIAYYHGNNAFLLVNTTDRERGIVPAGQVDAVIESARAVLSEVRDPETGTPVVAAARVPPPGSGIGGPNGGALYLDLAPGYDFRADLDGPVVERVRPRGEHRPDPDRDDLKSVFLIAGPNIPSGRRIDGVENTAVAATVAALLGIRPPAQATASAIEEALGRGGR